MTISQYLTIERCKKAAELLSSSEYQIQEISSFVGYSDNNYFVKVFRKSMVRHLPNIEKSFCQALLERKGRLQSIVSPPAMITERIIVAAWEKAIP